MGFIMIDENGMFKDSMTHQRFLPIGCNYFDPLTGWAPKVWEKFDFVRVAKHFGQMAELGVRMVRVFLTIASFMEADGGLHEEGIGKAVQLIEIARANGIKVQFAGPVNWEASPDWAESYFQDEPNAYFLHAEWMDRLERFWEAFAGYFKDEETVIGYDLLNEPWLHWDSPLIRQKWGGQPPAETAEGSEPLTMMTTAFTYMPTGDVEKWYAFQLFREQLAYEWVERLTKAIRSADSNHLVTVGFHQLSLPDNPAERFNPTGFTARLLTPLISYVAFHWYPYLDHLVKPHNDREVLQLNIERIRASVQGARSGKAFVLEEFGWYGGAAVDSWGKNLPFVSEEMQAEWCKLVIEGTKDIMEGWLCWGYADVPDSGDITRYSGLVDKDEQLKAWGKEFQRLARSLESAVK